MPANLTAVTLPTERLQLTPLVVADADEMVGVLAGPELYAFTGGEPPSLEELRSRYSRVAVGRSADGRQLWFNWIVRRSSDGRAVGTVQATVMGRGEQAEIAWIIGLRWQGQGYASEAARALVAWLTAAGVEEIVAHVHPEHAASAAVACSAGLVPTREVQDGEIRWVLGAVDGR